MGLNAEQTVVQVTLHRHLPQGGVVRTRRHDGIQRIVMTLMGAEIYRSMFGQSYSPLGSSRSRSSNEHEHLLTQSVWILMIPPLS